LLIHDAGLNLSRILQRTVRVGTARQAAEPLAALWLSCLRLMHAANRVPWRLHLAGPPRGRSTRGGAAMNRRTARTRL